MSLNKNTLNKQDTQKRIILATLISFVFFIAYDIFYIKPQQELQAAEQKAKQEKIVKQKSTVSSVNEAPKSSVVTTSSKAPDSKNVEKSSIVTTITTAKNIIKIDNLGRIAQVVLTDKQYIDKDNAQIKLFTSTQLRPLEVRFSNSTINELAFKNNIKTNIDKLDATTKAAKLILTQNLGDVVLTKNLTFYPDGHYDVEIKTSKAVEFFVTPGFRPNVLVDMYAVHGAILFKSDNTIETIKDDDMDNSRELSGVQIASAFDRYYATVLYNLDKNLNVSVMKDATNSPNIFIHAKSDIKLGGYIGPKEYKTLHALDPRLTHVIDYGWFTFIAKPMFTFLQFVHGFTGNWGWAIVVLIIIIKLVLFPLSYKGMTSMNRLKELAPRIKQIQEKYKDDKQKASMHMMELYKKEGANPMGGCLPMILQIPVFFAIYRVLLNAIELKGAPWILWIHDLAAMDPYYVLPILMGATMFIQQKITPNTMTDPTQQKMFQFLPVVFTFFFLWFPAGLTLYWFMNNLLTVAQQFYINKVFEKQKGLRHEKHIKEKHLQKKK